jgi:hypothetical protein
VNGVDFRAEEVKERSALGGGNVWRERFRRLK